MYIYIKRKSYSLLKHSDKESYMFLFLIIAYIQDA